jgi:transposase
MLEICARARAGTGRCPSCGQVSRRVHSRYERVLADAAVGGRGCRIRLQMRRYFCDHSPCCRRTFAEQVDGLTTRHSRRTVVLQSMLEAIALALAGRAGSRLARRLGIATSRDSLLRLVRALPERPVDAVPVLGVDDFAFRRGRHYGTVLIDMGRRRPIEVFDGRDGTRLAEWLRLHPEVTVICRDRGGGYAGGARQGAPNAAQVADRFHLWQNLGQAVEKAIIAHRAELVEAPPAQPPSDQAPALHNPVLEKKIVARMRHQYTAVQRLRGEGLSKSEIGRRLGLHPATVRKLANATSLQELTAKTDQRAHLVDDYVEYLHQRWNAGERNATQLFREISALGYPGGELAVQRYLRRFRTSLSTRPVAAPKPPSVREVTGWMLTHPDRLPEPCAVALKTALARSQALDRLAGHVRAFAGMITGLRGEQLPAWIDTVEHDSFTAPASFARNLRRDYQAVHNGLTLPHSSGPVEGNINRIKTIKRQMYGRANLDLLRKRILLS